jgi:hypothetical protein
MKQSAYLIVGLLLGVSMTTILFTSLSNTVSSQDRDPVKLSPQFYKVLLDNDQVRVLEYRLKPGEKEVMHSHAPGVVYGFNDAKTRSTLPDGKATESTGTAGSVFWRDLTTHALENIGKTEVHALAVELKNPCKP